MEVSVSIFKKNQWLNFLNQQQVSQLQCAIVLRRSPPKKVSCPRGLACSNNSPGGFEILLISQKRRSYPSRIFKMHSQEIHFGCSRVPRGILRCQTGSSMSETFWSIQKKQQQALKFFKSPKTQKSYHSRVSYQALLGDPLQGPKGAQRYPEGPLRVTLV